MGNDGYITYEEASRVIGKRPFSALTKPVGSRCNLNCTYCYYLDKERFYGDNPPILPDDILENYIQQYIEANDTPEVTFVWHGGEPLMAGLGFYEKVIAYQNKYNTRRAKIVNSLQTNGVLLNDQWCRFFKKYDFLIGVSIDGPDEIYSAYRRNKSGENVFDKVLRGIKLLQAYQVEFNSLSVVNKMSEGRGREIYRFLKQIGVQYMQFLPSVDYVYKNNDYKERLIISPFVGDAKQSYDRAEWSVSAKGYGEFLIDVFDEWLVEDVGGVFVQIFDMTLCAWVGQRPPVCSYQESCGDVLVVEHNGDVYSCDHFVFPEYKLGNIQTTKISEMLGSSQQLNFGLNKRNSLSGECLRCPYYFACRGECPKHRHIPTHDNKLKYSLCEGVKMFYLHITPYMDYMRDMLIQQKSPAYVMQWAKQNKNK